MTTVALIGATGLVGRSVWPLLERSYDLLVLGRRASGAGREKLGSMDQWPRLLADQEVGIAVSTLGSTRKAAGSWEAFEAVDRHAVLAFAAAARGAGARQFLHISSVGADASASTPYLRLKGEVEEALARIGFERLDIVRPGLLLGERVDDDRPMERIAARLSPLLAPLLRGRLDRYAAIPATKVARALAVLAGRPEPGRFLHFNRDIARLAEGA